MPLFCFINFGVDHGFFKKISFGTLCLKSLVEKEDVAFFYKDSNKS